MIAFGINDDFVSKFSSLAKKIAKKIIESKIISENVTMGFVKYGSSVMEISQLGQFTTNEDILSYLARQPISSTGNDLKKALQYISDNIFKVGFGTYFNIPKFIVVITNQLPNKDVKQTLRLLQKNGVKVVMFALGVDIRKSDLIQLAVDSGHVVNNDSNLDDIDIAGTLIAGLSDPKQYQFIIYLFKVIDQPYSGLMSKISPLLIFSKLYNHRKSYEFEAFSVFHKNYLNTFLEIVCRTPETQATSH